MNNLSEEVLAFYLELWAMAREGSLNKVQDDAETTITRVVAGEEEVDVISNQKALSALTLFEKMLPSNLMVAFKKSVENTLRVKDDAKSAMLWVDLDRFLDQSVILFLRFNKLHAEPLKRLYFAWTLFSVDYLDFDQIYIMLKLLAWKDDTIVNKKNRKQEITFQFPAGRGK
jgi:hypothetical protein